MTFSVKVGSLQECGKLLLLFDDGDEQFLGLRLLEQAVQKLFAIRDLLVCVTTL
jgi:hypothetical protein